MSRATNPCLHIGNGTLHTLHTYLVCELGGGDHLDATISLGSGGQISLTPRVAKKSTQSHPKFLIFLPQKFKGFYGINLVLQAHLSVK